jgi:hypothetical protein
MAEQKAYRYYVHRKSDYEFLLRTDSQSEVQAMMLEHGDDIVVEEYKPRRAQ